MSGQDADRALSGGFAGAAEGLCFLPRAKGSQRSVLSRFLWALSPVRRARVKRGSWGPVQWPGGGRTRGLHLSSAFSLLCLPALLRGSGKCSSQMCQTLVQGTMLGPQRHSQGGHSQPPTHYPCAEPPTLSLCQMLPPGRCRLGVS